MSSDSDSSSDGMPTNSFKMTKKKHKPKSVDQQYEELKTDAVKKLAAYKKANKGNKTYLHKKIKDLNGENPEGPHLPVGPDGILPDFDLKEIKDDACIAIFGKRRTGKSFAARHILYEKRDVFQHGMVITKTKFNGYWQNYFPMAVIHGSYSPQALESFMRLQLKIADENKKRPPDKKVNRKAVVVLDDIIADKKIRYCDTLATLFYNGRHFDIMLIICSQYVFGIPPGLRGNADFAITFVQNQKRQRLALKEDYADKIYDDDEFYRTLDDNTADHGTVVVDLQEPNKPVEECFFHWKAEEVPMFEIGSLPWKKQVWLEGEEGMKAEYTMR